MRVSRCFAPRRAAPALLRSVLWRAAFLASVRTRFLPRSASGGAARFDTARMRRQLVQLLLFRRRLFALAVPPAFSRRTFVARSPAAPQRSRAAARRHACAPLGLSKLRRVKPTRKPAKLAYSFCCRTEQGSSALARAGSNTNLTRESLMGSNPGTADSNLVASSSLLERGAAKI